MNVFEKLIEDNAFLIYEGTQDKEFLKKFIQLFLNKWKSVENTYFEYNKELLGCNIKIIVDDAKNPSPIGPLFSTSFSFYLNSNEIKPTIKGGEVIGFF